MVDWVTWHDAYAQHSWLSIRLEVVQHQLRNCLNDIPQGPVRILSICAGDGRDVIGVLASHKRRHDVSALLLELNPKLTASARVAVERERLMDTIEIRCADATKSTNFRSETPADIILACGVFGNITDFEALNFVRFLKCVCKKEGVVIFTQRASSKVDARLNLLDKVFVRYGFFRNSLEISKAANHAVAVYRLQEQPRNLPNKATLFKFVGYDVLDKRSQVIQLYERTMRKLLILYYTMLVILKDKLST